ncbi:serine/threonine protein kinase [Dolichospermum sp. ST_con]|nr:serine/threonine protein kinase [Dolichospermum sp. ST_con]MDD1420145.1 serine/threonine protein kinase [Dolichospermum sp. ST_sed1]MDD1422990.1 serine/threonine protein kinase [Dolichospermum sp. ST_sed9]MDD1434642.1 serine/threonine protein kinase [Dolichospermum sp. ST_sed6]MDD1435494.1 serine/threonine protein kinase [Dolichospermum sp. ST_sed10]MDD1441669.1 serine/threonine protein kinase [Dolichospermum sp. ST_sed3]MDD1447415.1 serine/threonine protein kinase [Dolichospermum sp. ST_s
MTLLNNRYQVIQVLGAGGFGETFLAEDTYMPSRRRCVIKQLKPISNDPQTYELIQKRFEREAATLEYLGEANDQIPQLFAYFSENGLFYLVQEWVHGQTLTNVIQSQGQLQENTVREILLSLLSVLDYVHSKGIIHRDIKPDNIIWREIDNKPVLIDFGAVKETIRTTINAAGHPTQSLVIGTPGFMPSEQAIGRPVYATDIYSLGLTAIYLLTGKYPQELETHPHTGQIIWQDYAGGVSPQLAMVLTQAIEPRTSDRFTTAAKMLYALKSEASTVPQVNNTVATIRLTPPKAISSPSQNPVIKTANNSRIWQTPTMIIGGFVVGIMGAVAISSMNRPETRNSIATNSNITSTSTQTPTPIITNTPISEPTLSPTPSILSEPIESIPENTPIPMQTIEVSTPQPEAEIKNEEKQTSIVPTTEPALTIKETLKKKREGKRDQVVTNIIRETVPAFPTGTSRSSVEATLGKKKDLRGLWSNTRAVTYKVVPDKIDLGYLFDKKTGTLKQTEAAFASSVEPEVMQTTLNGLLNGEATAEIKQGLEQVQQRQTDNFTFSKGGVKGQIVRQSCDFIYISIWDADLHDFVNLA